MESCINADICNISSKKQKLTMALSNGEIDDDNVTHYEWKAMIPTNGQTIDSTTFFLKNIQNFQCIISMRLGSTDNIEVLVKKSYFEPAEARITLTVGKGFPIIENISDWTEVCKFPNIPKDTVAFVLPVQSQTIFGMTSSNSDFFFSNAIGSQFDKKHFTKQPTTTQTTNLINPSITISCKIEWFGFVNDMRSLLSFQKGFRDLYLKPEFSDLEIKIGNTKLPVHKIILIAQSKRFSMEVATDLKCIEITDVSMDTMKEVLWYLYSGETKAIENTDVAVNIFAAAVNYNITELKDVCVSTLIKNLSTDNALQILKVAYEYKVVELYKKILSFMTKNKEKISSQKYFKDLLINNPELMYEFLMLLWVVNP